MNMRTSRTDLLGGTAVPPPVLTREIVIGKPRENNPKPAQNPATPQMKAPKDPEPQVAESLFGAVDEWIALYELYKKAVRVVNERQTDHAQRKSALEHAEQRLRELTATVERLRAEFTGFDLEFSAAQEVLRDPVYQDAGRVLTTLRSRLNGKESR
jgi:hypothetical protein